MAEQAENSNLDDHGSGLPYLDHLAEPRTLALM